MREKRRKVVHQDYADVIVAPSDGAPEIGPFEVPFERNGVTVGPVVKPMAVTASVGPADPELRTFVDRVVVPALVARLLREP